MFTQVEDSLCRKCMPQTMHAGGGELLNLLVDVGANADACDRADTPRR